VRSDTFHGGTCRPEARSRRTWAQDARFLAHPVFAYFHGPWGRRPQPPGICRFAPETWHGGRRRTPKATSPRSLDRGPPATRALAGGRVAAQQSGFPNAMNRVWGPDLSSAAAYGTYLRLRPTARDPAQQTPGGRTEGKWCRSSWNTARLGSPCFWPKAGNPRGPGTASPAAGRCPISKYARAG